MEIFLLIPLVMFFGRLGRLYNVYFRSYLGVGVHIIVLLVAFLLDLWVTSKFTEENVRSARTAGMYIYLIYCKLVAVIGYFFFGACIRFRLRRKKTQ